MYRLFIIFSLLFLVSCIQPMTETERSVWLQKFEIKDMDELLGEKFKYMHYEAIVTYVYKDQSRIRGFCIEPGTFREFPCEVEYAYFYNHRIK